MKVNSIGYQVVIGSESIKALTAFLKKGKYSQYFILGDENTIQHCLPALISKCQVLSKAEVFEVESGEVSKGLSICSQLWQTMLDYKADKQALIINLGGGVICDLGGFIASVYKRGIDFVNIPTSLLAMTDASIGGKTGINLEGVKNVLGTITQPKGVFIIPEFLATLPERHIDNGLAEIYKIALISDKAFWNKLAVGKTKGIEELITRSVQLKNNIVKKDPGEKNIRKALNFGHTIGHAMESACFGRKEDLLHGEAIIIGMLCESFIAYKKKLISKDEMTEITQILRFTFTLNKVSSSEFQKVGEFLLNDKKNKNGKILFALPDGIGKCRTDVAVNENLIAQSLDFYNSIANAKA
jgi:3-dehydroquinate synthase